MKKRFLFCTFFASLCAASLTYTACADESEMELTAEELAQPLSKFLKEFIKQDEALVAMIDTKTEEALKFELQKLEDLYLSKNKLKKRSLSTDHQCEILNNQISFLSLGKTKEGASSHPSKAIMEIYQKLINQLKTQVKKLPNDGAFLTIAMQQAQKERDKIGAACAASDAPRTQVKSQAPRYGTITHDSHYEDYALDRFLSGSPLTHFYRAMVIGLYGEVIKLKFYKSTLVNESKHFCPVHGFLGKEKMVEGSAHFKEASRDCTAEQLDNPALCPEDVLEAGKVFGRKMKRLPTHISTSHTHGAPTLSLHELSKASAQAFIANEQNPKTKALKAMIVSLLDYLDGYDDSALRLAVEEIYLLAWTCNH